MSISSNNETNIIHIYNFKIMGKVDINVPYNIPLNQDGTLINDNSNHMNVISSDKSYTTHDPDIICSIDLLKSVQNGGTILNKEKMDTFYKIYNIRNVLLFKESEKIIYYDEEYKRETIKLFEELSNFLQTHIYIDDVKKQIDNTNREYTEITKKNPLTEEQKYMYYHIKIFKGGIIYKIKSEDKYVIFGDIWGDYHLFYRNLFRLSKLKILNMETLEICDGYKLVFLGNIINYGLLGFEILSVIVKMYNVNNKGSDINLWKIFLNECASIYKSKIEINTKENIYINRIYESEFIQMLRKEIVIKTNDSEYANTICDYINYIFMYLSRAIVIEKNNQKIWLCTDGFPKNGNINNYTESLNFIDEITADKIKTDIFSDNGNINQRHIDEFRANYIIRSPYNMSSTSIFIDQDMSIDQQMLLKNNETINDQTYIRRYDHIPIFSYCLYGSSIKCYATPDNHVVKEGPVYTLTIHNSLNNYEYTFDNIVYSNYIYSKENEEPFNDDSIVNKDDHISNKFVDTALEQFDYSKNKWYNDSPFDLENSDIDLSEEYMDDRQYDYDNRYEDDELYEELSNDTDTNNDKFKIFLDKIKNSELHKKSSDDVSDISLNFEENDYEDFFGKKNPEIDLLKENKKSTLQKGGNKNVEFLPVLSLASNSNFKKNINSDTFIILDKGESRSPKNKQQNNEYDDKYFEKYYLDLLNKQLKRQYVEDPTLLSHEHTNLSKKDINTIEDINNNEIPIKIVENKQIFICYD